MLSCEPGLQATKATGHDGISPRLLIDSADIIAHNLTIILGIFPDELKVAIIAPIFKSGTKIETTNYRPISLLSAVAKLFEGLVSKQLVEYLDANDILAPEQAGFRKNYSTQMIFLDLKKAFNCVNHEILIEKMALYGFTKHKHVRLVYIVPL